MVSRTIWVIWKQDKTVWKSRSSPKKIAAFWLLSGTPSINNVKTGKNSTSFHSSSARGELKQRNRSWGSSGHWRAPGFSWLPAGRAGPCAWLRRLSQSRRGCWRCLLSWRTSRKIDFSSVVLTLPLPALQNQLFSPEDCCSPSFILTSFYWAGNCNIRSCSCCEDCSASLGKGSWFGKPLLSCKQSALSALYHSLPTKIRIAFLALQWITMYEGISKVTFKFNVLETGCEVKCWEWRLFKNFWLPPLPELGHLT